MLFSCFLIRGSSEHQETQNCVRIYSRERSANAIFVVNDQFTWRQSPHIIYCNYLHFWLTHLNESAFSDICRLPKSVQAPPAYQQSLANIITLNTLGLMTEIIWFFSYLLLSKGVHLQSTKTKVKSLDWKKISVRILISSSSRTRW